MCKSLLAAGLAMLAVLTLGACNKVAPAADNTAAVAASADNTAINAAPANAAAGAAMAPTNATNPPGRGD
jgi:hypothetical protein